MSTTNMISHETNNQIHCQTFSPSTSDDDEDFIDDDDSNDRLVEKTNRNKNKKTLGRVKIKMAYIENKIRRYTTFSKRKTGIMKKAYELATLTGTEVMLLVASETGHVYTYATAKLQPMITSEAGKALIQTCLAKDEPILDTPITTLNNNDVICVDDNQRKKRANTSIDTQLTDLSSGTRPIKRTKLKSSDELSSSSLNKTKSIDLSSCSSSSPHIFPSQTTTTVALPLPCFIHPDSQQTNSTVSPAYTIDLNTLKNNGMNIIFAPSTTNSTESSSSSSSTSSPKFPLVVTLGNISYQPS